MSKKRCITHHHACDCRERKFADIDEKLRKIREALVICDERDNTYGMALFDFYLTVAQILGE